MSTETKDVASSTSETTSSTTGVEKKQISKAELTKLVNDGKKKDEIMSHYGLNASQTTKLLKDAGLKIRKFAIPVYKLVD